MAPLPIWTRKCAFLLVMVDAHRWSLWFPLALNKMAFVAGVCFSQSGSLMSSPPALITEISPLPSCKGLTSRHHLPSLLLWTIQQPPLSFQRWPWVSECNTLHTSAPHSGSHTVYVSPCGCGQGARQQVCARRWGRQCKSLGVFP